MFLATNQSHQTMKKNVSLREIQTFKNMLSVSCINLLLHIHNQFSLTTNHITGFPKISGRGKACSEKEGSNFCWYPVHWSIVSVWFLTTKLQ